MFPKICLFLLIIVCNGEVCFAYQVGVGIADCTGPPVEVRFTGYAKRDQIGCGIHLRQFSRAFIIDDGENRAAFVSVDAMGISHAVRQEVLQRLNLNSNDTYSVDNLMISATHTHSTPGGYFKNTLYDAPEPGFVKESFETLVEGITQSLIDAHENMVDAKIYMTNGTLLNATVNRSPAAYLYNLHHERELYEYDVDKEMVQLQFVSTSDDTPIGIINWFPVHGTSMNSHNCLVSSDNLGYASILLESHFNNHSVPGRGPFVGAFASANQGDVSPNTRGPRCVSTGRECDFITSTCKGNNTDCLATGPGGDMFESTAIIATMLFNKSKELFYGNDRIEVEGPVRYIHQFVDMPEENATIVLSNGTEQMVYGCRPAMGYSFGAGTTDGPGIHGFSQAILSGKILWEMATHLEFPVTRNDAHCQYPKKILLNTGRPIFFHNWEPRIVSTQIITIGQAVIIGVPAEFTTMSGRRMKESIKTAILENGGPENAKPIIAGLCNSYSSYVTTFEEYQLQRYEGGSTLFGPYTLTLYIEKYKQLAEALMKNESIDSGPEPNVKGRSFSLVRGPSHDCSGLHKFGHVLQQPPPVVRVGFTVTVKFVAGNPRHSLLRNHAYLVVEKLEGYEWIAVATDANWETKFRWERTHRRRKLSVATIDWSVPPSARDGVYRIRHFGHYKNILRRVRPYSGTTKIFEVL